MTRGSTTKETNHATETAEPRMHPRGTRSQPILSHGSNTDESRTKDEEFEQEQTEKGKIMT
jgi:hypothetical protein